MLLIKMNKEMSDSLEFIDMCTNKYKTVRQGALSVVASRKQFANSPWEGDSEGFTEEVMHACS